MSRVQDASEALEMLKVKLAEQNQDTEWSSSDMGALFCACLERNAIDLCLSIFRNMSSIPRSGDLREKSFEWPAINLEIVCSLVLALTRRIRVNDALSVVQTLLDNGAASSTQEIMFGKVISSPIPPHTPLAVIQPQEGTRTVACATSR